MRRIILTITLALGFAVHSSAQINKNYFVWAGRDMIMDNRYREAIGTLNILLRADPDAYEGYFWRGVAKYHLDDFLGAERDFTAALDKNPVYTSAYQFRALARSRMGDYGSAMPDFAEAIDLRPDYPAPYFSRGVVRLMTEEYPAAEADFDMYIRLVDNDPDAYANRGLAHLNQRDTTAARADFDRAVAARPHYPRGYLERGNLSMAGRDYAAAIADFDKAVECDSLSAQAYFCRAIAYFDTGQPGKTLEDLDRVIELDPMSAVAYYNRAIARDRTGDYNRAVDDYDRVAVLSPDNVAVFYNRGNLHARLGDMEAALADFDKAIELYPDFTNAYLARADVRYILHDTKGAEKDRRTARRKIDEYRSRIDAPGDDSMADTTRRFDALLSFRSAVPGTQAGRAIYSNARTALRPQFRFSLSDSGRDDYSAHPRPIAEFMEEVGYGPLAFADSAADTPADTLLRLYAELMSAAQRPGGRSWRDDFLQGVAQSQLRRYTNAVALLTSAIDAAPSEGMLYVCRSSILAEMTDFISALDSYSRLAPDNAPAGSDRTVRMYDYDDAIADLNKAAKLLPLLPHVYYNRGNLLALSGRFAEACADYTHAITLDSAFADAYFNRGLVLIYTNDTRNGLLDLSKAGELGIAEAYDLMRAYNASGNGN